MFTVGKLSKATNAYPTNKTKQKPTRGCVDEWGKQGVIRELLDLAGEN